MAFGANCTVVPADAETNSGVAGTGVLLSFVITNLIALALASIITFAELTRRSETKILRKLLLSFSDQQIITGIGIQCVGIAQMKTMIPYHLFLIFLMSSLATSTHSATLMALVSDFKRDWVLRWLRQFLMGINLVLSCVTSIFLLMSLVKDIPTTLPIACVWSDDAESLNPQPGTSRTDNTPFSVAGTIATMVAQVIVFAISIWYLHMRAKKWLKIIQVIAVTLLLALGVGATVRVFMVAQAFGNDTGVALRGGQEGDWGFGQVLSMLLLLLPILSALEILRGEVRVKSPMVDDHIPLRDLDDRDFKR